MVLWALSISLTVLVFTGVRLYQNHLSSRYSELDVGWVYSAMAIPFLVPVLAYVVLTEPFVLGPSVLVALGVSIAANVAGSLLMFGAFKRDAASVVVPLTALQPIVIAVFEPLFVEYVRLGTLVGSALLATIGAFVVLSDGSVVTPFAKLRDRGPQMAMLATGAFSASSIADGYATKQVSPLGYAGLLTLGIALVFTVVLLVRRREGVASLPLRTMPVRDMIGFGGIRAAFLVLIMLSFSLASATRVSVAMQLVPILVILASGRLFDESHLKVRLVGSVLIGAGVVVAL